MNIAPFKYADKIAPTGYVCAYCARAGCKLWREYQTFANHTTLLCHDCSTYEQDHAVAGSETTPDSDAIGWRVPAILTEEGDTFWGYTSVPQDGVDWWRQLPTRV